MKESVFVSPPAGLNALQAAIDKVSASGLAGIALEAVDGGAVEDVLVERVEMRSGVQTPFFLRVGAWNKDWKNNRTKVGKITERKWEK